MRREVGQGENARVRGKGSGRRDVPRLGSGGVAHDAPLRDRFAPLNLELHQAPRETPGPALPRDAFLSQIAPL